MGVKEFGQWWGITATEEEDTVQRNSIGVPLLSGRYWISLAEKKLLLSYVMGR